MEINFGPEINGLKSPRLYGNKFWTWDKWSKIAPLNGNKFWTLRYKIYPPPPKSMLRWYVYHPPSPQNQCCDGIFTIPPPLPPNRCCDGIFTTPLSPQINVAMEYFLEEVLLDLANVGIHTVFVCLNTLDHQYLLEWIFTTLIRGRG